MSLYQKLVEILKANEIQSLRGINSESVVAEQLIKETGLAIEQFNDLLDWIMIDHPFLEWGEVSKEWEKILTFCLPEKWRPYHPQKSPFNFFDGGGYRVNPSPTMDQYERRVDGSTQARYGKWRTDDSEY